MQIKIYQINMQRDSRRVCFLSLDNTGKVDAKIYDRVFAGEVDCDDLEDVFIMFNCKMPDGYIGRSMSVSDVVEVIQDNGESYFSFCDNAGFVDIEFDPKLVGVPELPSACLICRKRKSCLDSVQAHKTTDECFEKEREQK